MPRPFPALLLAALLGACASTPQPPETPETPEPPGAAEAREEPAAAAEPAEPNPFVACRQPVDNEVAVLDETRRRLQETVCGASLWFDGLFGQSDLAAARTAHGRLETSVAHSEFEGTKVRVRFNARVDLPALKRRLSAFVGRDDDEEFVRDRSEGLALRSQFPRVADEEEWLAGLGYALPEAHRFKFDFRVGARGVAHPTVFARTRFSYNAYSDRQNLVNLRTTPFIDNKVGLGLTSSIDLNHALAPTRLLRWGTIGTVSEESSGLDWRSALILYQNLQRLRAIAGELFVRGATAAPEPLTEYGARTIYRHPLFQDRMFAELVLGYSWPRIDPALERDGSFGASFGLELPFGVQD